MPEKEKQPGTEAGKKAYGKMTVEEAGHKGGEVGGQRVKEKYGPEFYSEIGHKGGQVRGRQIHEAAEYFKEHPEEKPKPET